MTLARSSLIIVLLAISFSCLAGEIVLRGVYQGKDIFVQNPYSRAEQRFCTISVFVNDKETISNPSASAYKVNLAHLDLRDIVVIRINYREGCTPRVINPEVIQPTQGFEFLTSQASRYTISWLSKGELPGGKFFIERQQENESWKVVEEVESRGNIQPSNYEVGLLHNEGNNNYRIKYASDDDIVAYSITFSYDFEVNPVTFVLNDTHTKIFLSEEAEYEIIDFTGRKFKRGLGRIISIQSLEPGEYYLEIKNQSMRFEKEDLD